MYFDTHAHVDDARFDEDRAAMLENCREKGVSLIMNIGAHLASSRAAVALSEQYENIYATVGFHPCDTYDLTEENLIRIAREGAAAMKGDRIYNIKGWKEMAKRCINPIQILPDTIAKNVKAGDKLDNSNMQTEMAVIYDMSSLECELAVDELDIKNVEVNQPVTISSDAIEGKVYNGIVTNVSVNGTTSGGVTTYPVTIVITDFDKELLPGMNIDVEIITSKAKDVLAVPVAAVNRGSVVYVKGEKTDDKDTAPDGYKSVRVETGVYNAQFIEIKSGLKEGDVVYIPQIMSTGGQTRTPGMMGMPGGMSGGTRMPSGGMSGGMPGGMSGGTRMPSGGMSGGARMPSGGMSGGMR